MPKLSFPIIKKVPKRLYKKLGLLRKIDQKKELELDLKNIERYIREAKIEVEKLERKKYNVIYRIESLTHDIELIKSNYLASANSLGD